MIIFKLAVKILFHTNKTKANCANTCCITFHTVDGSTIVRTAVACFRASCKSTCHLSSKAACAMHLLVFANLKHSPLSLSLLDCTFLNHGSQHQHRRHERRLAGWTSHWTAANAKRAKQTAWQICGRRCAHHDAFTIAMYTHSAADIHLS